MLSREPWRLEDPDAELKLWEKKVRERKQKLDRLEEEAKKQPYANRVEMEEKVADHRDNALIKDEELTPLELNLCSLQLALKDKEEKLKGRERVADLQRREWELKIRNDATERQARALASEEKPEPLLQPEAKKKDKDDDAWNKRQIYASMALVNGLTVLFQIRTDLPPEHLAHILGAFGVLWLLGSLAFLSALVGTRKLEKEFSRHAGRLTFMCLSLLVLYALYLMSQPGRSTSISPCTCPPPPAVTPPRDPVLRPFYIALVAIAILGHIFFWPMGGDKDLK